MPRDREDPEAPPGQPQGHHPGVDVAVARELREVQDRAVGVDLHGLLPGDEAKRVEVVDAEVAEDPGCGMYSSCGGAGSWQAIRTT